MKIFVGIGLATLLAPMVATATVHKLTALADDLQETTACPASNAVGTVGATLDDSTNTLSWNVNFGNNAPSYNNGTLTGGAETGKHFHGPAAPGATAGITIDLGLGNPRVGSMVVSPADETDILNGLWYINIHSTSPAACTGGEIRGQLLVATPSPAPAFSRWGLAGSALLLSVFGIWMARRRRALSA